MPGPFDHILIAVFCIVIPVWGFLSNTEENRSTLRTSPAARISTYWKITALQWSLVGAAVLIWIRTARPWAELGLQLTVHWRFLLGAGFVCLGATALFVHQSIALRSPARLRSTRAMLDSLAPFLPRDQRELRSFSVLAVTAGVCEELLYRGYLFWYLVAYIGPSPLGWTWVVLLGAVIFAAAHLYQGARGVVQVFAVGLVLGGLYIFTGTLLLGIVAHAVMDLNGGMLAVCVYGAEAGPGDDGSDTAGGAPTGDTP